MFEHRFSVEPIKNALVDALNKLQNELPNWSDMTNFVKGKVIDETFKSILKDLMDQFGMKPREDYVDNLKSNEPNTDFVALSQQADELIRGLMEGNIIVISEHNRVSKLGNTYTVKPRSVEC